ncbi:hypothetical protein CU097_001175, partial [Rhizopus azygosporus]
MLYFSLFLFCPLVFAFNYCTKDYYDGLSPICPAKASTDVSPSLFPDLMTTTRQTASSTPIKPFSSFEEWQKQVLKDSNGSATTNNNRHRSSQNEKKKTLGQTRQVVDSLDGGLSDDLGSMFENLMDTPKSTQNVYDEKQYISPIGQDKKVDNLKYLKERFNYASVDCAATVRKANKEAKGAQSILFESKDQYMLNKCSTNKFVIINLCEQIRVDTIVMANFEFFSSTFKDFKVYASSKYPTDDWRLLGQWRAKNTRDLQVFRVPESPWTNYIKIEFLTHYGHEYYCPLSLVRVHGMSMMELYTTIESNDEDDEESPMIEPEHLWPAEIREQIIQPQFDIGNTSESFPIKIDEDDAKPEPVEAHEPIIPEIPGHETHDQEASEQVSETPKEEQIESRQTSPESDSRGTCAQETAILTLPMDKPLMTTVAFISSSESVTVSSSTQSITMNTPTPDPVHSSNTTEDHNRPIVTQHKTHHTKEAITQESIYKTIMKRLSVLEHNMTLSQRFLDDQNKVLNDVFLEMEKRHQEQLIVLIGHLNETASQKIDNMASLFIYFDCKKRYEQWYANMKDQTESDMREMTTKINLLADQLSFEKKLSLIQLTILITLFVYMALSKGTLSTLSPIIAAQLEERRKRKTRKHPELFIDT